MNLPTADPGPRPETGAATSDGRDPAGGVNREGSVRTVRTVGVLAALAMVLAGGVNLLRYTVQQQDSVEHPLPATITAVQVQSGAGGIRVRPASPGESNGLRARREWSLVAPTVEVTTRDGLLVVGVDCGPVVSWLGDGCRADWELVVPATTQLLLRASSGDIAISGMASSVTASTSSGDVTVTASSSPNLDLRATSGDVTARSRVAPSVLKAASTSGDVEVSVPDDGSRYRVDTRTTSGTVTNLIGTDPGAPRLIEATTTSGDVTLRRATQ